MATLDELLSWLNPVSTAAAAEPVYGPQLSPAPSLRDRLVNTGAWISNLLSSATPPAQPEVQRPVVKEQPKPAKKETLAAFSPSLLTPPAPKPIAASAPAPAAAPAQQVQLPKLTTQGGKPTTEEQAAYWDYVTKTSEKHGVPPQLARAVAMLESSGNFKLGAHNTDNPDSDGYGGFGIKKSTIADIPGFKPEDVNDPYKNAEGGILYMKQLHEAGVPWSQVPFAYQTGLAGARELLADPSKMSPKNWMRLSRGAAVMGEPLPAGAPMAAGGGMPAGAPAGQQLVQLAQQLANAPPPMPFVREPYQQSPEVRDLIGQLRALSAGPSPKEQAANKWNAISSALAAGGLALLGGPRGGRGWSNAGLLALQQYNNQLQTGQDERRRDTAEQLRGLIGAANLSAEDFQRYIQEQHNRASEMYQQQQLAMQQVQQRLSAAGLGLQGQTAAQQYELGKGKLGLESQRLGMAAAQTNEPSAYEQARTAFVRQQMEIKAKEEKAKERRAELAARDPKTLTEAERQEKAKLEQLLFKPADVAMFGTPPESSGGSFFPSWLGGD